MIKANTIIKLDATFPDDVEIDRLQVYSSLIYNNCINLN